MNLRKIILIILFSGMACIGWSQPQQPQDPAGDPDAVPITGIEYLLLAGGAYGVSRFLKNRKNKNNES